LSWGFHDVHHAYAVGQRFTVLSRGELLGTFERDEVDLRRLEVLMAGGQAMEDLAQELEDLLADGD
jgi:simple sugar transport system ATP-binding protein